MFTVLKRETPLVVVLLTDREKILLTTLSALIDSIRVYIFIAPFCTLVNNIVERFRANGLETIKWRYREYNLASVVVISVNIVV